MDESIWSDPDQGKGGPDTLTNMTNWAQTAGDRECWGLMREERWREPDGEKIEDFEEMFTRAQTAKAPVAFSLDRLTGLSLVVTGSMYGTVALSPASGGRWSPWWVMGDDRRVAGLCVREPGYRSGDEMPEAYVTPTKGDGK